jgi:mannose-6-phosphate isomerase
VIPVDELTAVSIELGPLLMRNPIRDYDWGSLTALARLQGREPSGSPEAELWIGAHPAASSEVVDRQGHRRDLAELIAADPVGLLGAQCLARFGARLPFLTKVLAVDRALSVQVHPDAEHAARGYVREETGGIPSGSALRSYVDPFPKPELVYALEAVEALAGLREREEAIALLDRVAGRGSRLADVRAAVGARGVVAGVEVLACWPDGDREGLVAEAVHCAADAARRLAGSAETARLGDALAWIPRLARQHPGDPMVAVPLLLRLIRLAPGRTMFIPSGVPHAYLSGMAVEVMAASDNVVRAGLTSKRVDVPELIALLDPDAAPVLDLVPEQIGPAEVAWNPPAPQFRLTRLQVGTANGGGPGDVLPDPSVSGPQVLLCTEGEVEMAVEGLTVRLGPGSSAFLGASASVPRLRGNAVIFRTAPGPVGVS